LFAAWSDAVPDARHTTRLRYRNMERPLRMTINREAGCGLNDAELLFDRERS